ncbi:MAG: hypothetical protein C0625_06060 [Arcobacter sp.]|nr:MAG: hypothetical protein C0625_06060 [Arcobacter sp.]
MLIDLKNSLGFKINKTSNHMLSIINPILAEFDIAIEQRATLEIIKYEDDVTLTKIAAILDKDKTTISRTVRVLEKKALIQRNNNSEDRRSTMLELTSKGEETLNNSQESITKFRNDLISNLSKEEIDTLFNLLDKVVLGLDSNKHD